MSEARYNILCLEPSQQAALRYCLYNLAQQKFVSYMEFVNKRPEFPLDKIGHNIMEIFRQYDTVCTHLSPFQGLDSFKGKKRLLMYKSSFWPYIMEAVNKYNFETASIVLGQEIANRIHPQMSKLTDLVTRSTPHTYTQEELKKASSER